MFPQGSSCFLSSKGLKNYVLELKINTVFLEIEHIREDDEYNASMEAARKAVHGKGDENFRQWTAFGPCSATCGRSLQTRTRSCKPGKICKGEAIESRTCIQTPCPGKLNMQFLLTIFYII